MGIFYFMVLAVVLGLVVYLIWTYTPIPVQFKKLILWAAIIVLIVILIRETGILSHDVAIPKVR